MKRLHQRVLAPSRVIDGVPHCLFPGCNGAEKSRGLCPRHYYRAWGLVNVGKTTWETLVANGRALPPKRGADDHWFLNTQRDGIARREN